MNTEAQAEKLLHAWVKISSIVKNTRLTKGLQYNESIVMLLIYNRYAEDGIGCISIKEITEETKMLKSLVNRTVNSLEKKGLLTRCSIPGDKRMTYVRCVKEKLGIFLDVHKHSLALSQRVIDIIGTEDTEAFIRLVKKIYDVKFQIQPQISEGTDV